MNLKDSSLEGQILVYQYIEFQDRTWVGKEKKSLCASLGGIVTQSLLHFKSINIDFGALRGTEQSNDEKERDDQEVILITQARKITK